MPLSWQLEEAKDHFEELVEAALTHGPQTVTRDGREVVIVFSMEDYRRMQDSTWTQAE
jgi:prevent-host-death family protein